MSKLDKYLRLDKAPNFICAGCTHGVAWTAMVRAIDNLKLIQNETIMACAIGCRSISISHLSGHRMEEHWRLHRELSWQIRKRMLFSSWVTAMLWLSAGITSFMRAGEI